MGRLVATQQLVEAFRGRKTCGSTHGLNKIPNKTDSLDLLAPIVMYIPLLPTQMDGLM